MLTKPELTNLYIEKNMKVREIAKIQNTHTQTIFRWLRKYGIKKLKNLQHIKKLTKRQIEIINGSMLGDGFCSKNSKTPKANWCFGNVQSKNPKGKVQGEDRLNKKEYMDWFLNEVGDLGNLIKECVRKGKVVNTKTGIRFDSSIDEYTTYYRLTCHAHPIFTSIAKKWYLMDEKEQYFIKDKKGWIIKKVPKDIILTPLTLAIWWCEDGINNPNTRIAVLCTDSFSLEDNNLLIEKLGKLGIQAYLGKQNRIRIKDTDNKSYTKFLKLVSKHVMWKCFQYKIKNPPTETKIRIGINHHRAKFTRKSDIKAIKTLRSQKWTLRKIATKYKVSVETIRGIVNNLSYLS